MQNERNAGRHPVFSDQTLEQIFSKYDSGESVTALANQYKVSRQTMSSYIAKHKNEEFIIEIGTDTVSSTMYRILAYWKRINADFCEIYGLSDELQNYNLRYDFMDEQRCMTKILINLKDEKVRIINEGTDIVRLAFGINQKPTWEDFLWFLEERCFSRNRFNLKSVLQDYNLDSYDVFQIVEQTGGRITDDHQWIKIHHFSEA